MAEVDAKILEEEPRMITLNNNKVGLWAPVLHVKASCFIITSI